MRVVPARASVANVPRIELAVLAERESPFSVLIDVGEPRKVRSHPSCEVWPSARGERLAWFNFARLVDVPRK